MPIAERREKARALIEFGLMIRAMLVVVALASCTQWQPFQRVPGASLRRISGDPSKSEAFRFQLKVPAGAHIESHRHTTDVHVKVLRGSMYITMSGVTHHFTTGKSFTISANTWHAEWWDQDSTMEASGVGPMRSEDEQAGPPR